MRERLEILQLGAGSCLVRGGFGFGGATVQFGENSDSYVDWRVRIGFEPSSSSGSLRSGARRAQTVSLVERVT